MKLSYKKERQAIALVNAELWAFQNCDDNQSAKEIKEKQTMNQVHVAHMLDMSQEDYTILLESDEYKNLVYEYLESDYVPVDPMIYDPFPVKDYYGNILLPGQTVLVVHPRRYPDDLFESEENICEYLNNAHVVTQIKNDLVRIDPYHWYDRLGVVNDHRYEGEELARIDCDEKGVISFVGSEMLQEQMKFMSSLLELANSNDEFWA